MGRLLFELIRIRDLEDQVRRLLRAGNSVCADLEESYNPSWDTAVEWRNEASRAQKVVCEGEKNSLVVGQIAG